MEAKTERKNKKYVTWQVPGKYDVITRLPDLTKTDMTQ